MKLKPGTTLTCPWKEWKSRDEFCVMRQYINIDEQVMISIDGPYIIS
jgi:hypothetical protein